MTALRELREKVAAGEFFGDTPRRPCRLRAARAEADNG